jgi:hypothetical protein
MARAEVEVGVGGGEGRVAVRTSERNRQLCQALPSTFIQHQNTMKEPPGVATIRAR